MADFANSGELDADIKRVAQQSEFFANYMSKPEGEALRDSGDLLVRRNQFSIELASDCSVIELDSSLRNIRNREMTRIIFRDQTRRADLVETTRDLSWLADECLETALQYHYAHLSQSWGVPTNSAGDPQQLCVLALGKLGANELNLSSDIDLVFLYDESGELPSSRTYHEFFIRLSQSLIKSLDETGPNGFVFRVDMRLRPYGESGALVMSRSAMEKYFVEQGREWERYAFIKARSAAGDVALGESFISWLQPFVFRKHIDYGAIESLRDMKQLINHEVKRQSLEEDVKLGAGGIREVEFIAQAQQLIWGGHRPELRQRRLLEVLDELEAEEYFPDGEVASLRAAYIFLRNTEHGIQAEKDQQTQRLPADSLGQSRLAAVMGYEEYGEFLVDLSAHRGRVSQIFAGLMNTSESEREDLLEGDLLWHHIWQEPDSEIAMEHISKSGFVDSSRVLDLIRGLQTDTGDLQEIADNRLSTLMPVLLRLVGREEQPDVTLERCFEVIDSILRRSIYLVFLNENLDALQRMIRLLSISSYVASQIAKYPILLYELTDWQVEQGLESKAALLARLDEGLNQHATSDLEARMDTLRAFKHSVVLKVAMLELLDLQPTMKASDQLTAIAEVVLQRSVDLAADYLVERHGYPGKESDEPDEINFVVIAYGKLGGYELGYGSDLDVVFIHGGDTAHHTVGEKSIHNNVFYNRLGQRVVHIITSFTRFGTLYDLDLRLRPDGNSGPLVPSLAGYQKYLLQSAWTWEVQALVRARYVAGSMELGDEFGRIRRSVLAQPRDSAQLRLDVVEMREKMRAHLDADTQPADAAEVLLSGFNLKQGEGAIVDIEFLVQFLVLRYSASIPALTEWTDKVRLLDSLARHGLIEAEQAALLQEAYVAYRAGVHFERLGGELGSYERFEAYRERVVRIWRQYLDS
jgi:glutamate-ammonia-ligase adenylyltransferase